MNPTGFQEGDVVRLKIGGPDMLVTGIITGGNDSRHVPGHLACKWITADGRAQMDSYPASVLVKAAAHPGP